MAERKRRRRPASTAAGRESKLVDLAYSLAEQQLEDGTASSQTLVHFLRLGTAKQEHETEKLRLEGELLQAKVEVTRSAQKSEELLAAAIDAFRGYSGQEPDHDDRFDDDDSYWHG